MDLKTDENHIDHLSMDGLLIASITLLFTVFCLIAGFIFKLWYDEKCVKEGIPATTTAQKPDLKRREKQTKNHEEVESIREEDERDERNRQKDDEDDGIPQKQSPKVGREEANESPNSDKKIGKKKQAKMQAKVEAKELREQQQKDRDEKKQREQEAAKKLEETRLLEEEEERKRREKLKVEREEKEKRELEEYMKLKDSFTVGEHGFENENDDANSESFISNFLDYIRKKKIVHIDELGSHYRLKSEDVVDRLNTFLREKLITGVFDDRGLFTFISDTELRDVAKFINQRGRVSLSELTENSNRLIAHTPKD